MVTTKPSTADDLFRMGDDAPAYELVQGALLPMVPTGGEHGEVGHEIGRHLGNHVADRRLGRVYAAETGFVLARNPDTVLAPDVAFIRTERLPPPSERTGYLAVPPDLVIEVVSPSDRPAAVNAKVAMYLDAGVKLVWVVEPSRRTVTVCHPDLSRRTLGDGAYLDGGDVVPGFRLAVAEVFR